MAVKESKPPTRKSKTSKRQHGAGGKTKLTELEKILISNGGMAHATLRQNRPKVAYGKSGPQRTRRERAALARVERKEQP